MRARKHGALEKACATAFLALDLVLHNCRAALARWNPSKAHGRQRQRVSRRRCWFAWTVGERRGTEGRRRLRAIADARDGAHTEAVLSSRRRLHASLPVVLLSLLLLRRVSSSSQYSRRLILRSSVVAPFLLPRRRTNERWRWLVNEANVVHVSSRNPIDDTRRVAGRSELQSFAVVGGRRVEAARRRVRETHDRGHASVRNEDVVASSGVPQSQ
mmetsp:Transcript_6828/g.21167  ORF Transcript_6828/g.21167 Transcript_6828/m.21167 type:complete len:215 (+) Transcript_6828:502-1146(+)